ncbi:MAG: hypothetical protein HQL82_15545 [Magnetococcales bacterium]|nr:hypothetical protein [Magnetococcales bacterium]
MTEKPRVTVRLTSGLTEEPLAFEAEIVEGGSRTSHRVTMDSATREHMGCTGMDPVRCVEAAFRFLLEREPKEAIMVQFDITVIGRYFPQFFREIGRYY